MYSSQSSFFSFFTFMSYDIDAIKFFTIVLYSIFFRELSSPRPNHLVPKPFNFPNEVPKNLKTQ